MRAASGKASKVSNSGSAFYLKCSHFQIINEGFQLFVVSPFTQKTTFERTIELTRLFIIIIVFYRTLKHLRSERSGVFLYAAMKKEFCLDFPEKIEIAVLSDKFRMKFNN